MKTLAIIVAAYNCPEFVGDCIRSVQRQIPAEGWTYDLRLGVDGCPATAKAIKVPYYYSRKNHGAYIIRNSLIYLAPADAYAYFDADDIMLPEYCRKSITALESCGAVMPRKTIVNAGLEPMSGKAVIENGGAITFTHAALEKVGGFYRWKVAGDTDFMKRLGMAGVKIHVIPEALYLRRIHLSSLTRSCTTGIGSQYRRQAWREMTANRMKGIIKIKPTTVKLERRNHATAS
jgi:GT2 family glycosyltransferase